MKKECPRNVKLIKYVSLSVKIIYLIPIIVIFQTFSVFWRQAPSIRTFEICLQVLTTILHRRYVRRRYIPGAGTRSIRHLNLSHPLVCSSSNIHYLQFSIYSNLQNFQCYKTFWPLKHWRFPHTETTFHTRRRTASYVTLKEQRKLDTNSKIVGKDVTIYSTKSWMLLLISYCDSNIKQVGHDTGAAWCYKNEHKKKKWRFWM